MANESIRREWDAEGRRNQIERKAMAVEREAWQKERADHRLEREALAVEREHWIKERADHENRERQEEEGKRALMVWQDLKPSSRCLRYGTREYSATLAQVSPGLDPLKECWKKSIDIHGQQMLPSRCETQVRVYQIFIIFFRLLEISSFFSSLISGNVRGCCGPLDR